MPLKKLTNLERNQIDDDIKITRKKELLFKIIKYKKIITWITYRRIIKIKRKI